MFTATGLLLGLIALLLFRHRRVTTWQLALAMVLSLTCASFVSSFATGWPDWHAFRVMEALSLVLSTVAIGWRLLARRAMKARRS